MWRIGTTTSKDIIGRSVIFLMMKIVSMNIRRLGESIKRKYARDLIVKEQVEIIYL